MAIENYVKLYDRGVIFLIIVTTALSFLYVLIAYEFIQHSSSLTEYIQSNRIYIL